MLKFMSRPSLSKLGWIFLRYGNFTFGGGTATITVIDRELIERRGLIRPDQARLSFALARLTPGTNLLAYCTAAGWLTRGLPGAFVSLIASSLPCSLAAVIVTVLYEAMVRQPAWVIAMHGAMAAAVGVMIATGWTIIRPFRKSTSILRIVIFSAGACALALAGVSPIQILLAAALFGCIFPGAQSS
jgi:chromate transporter